MSRVGNAPITVPQGVEVTLTETLVKVKGPKGELEQAIDSDAVSIKNEEGTISLSRKSDVADHRSKHGLYRALIFNMLEGVTNGYKKELELVGVGYRATTKGQILEMIIGYSHPVAFEIPSEVKVSANTEKGKAPVVTLESHDKQLVGQVAAKIRSLRKPEPYKGKGIKYKDEFIRRKAGKAAGK